MLDFRDIMLAREALLAAARAAAAAAAREAAEQARREEQAREAQRQQEAQNASNSRQNEQARQNQQAEQVNQTAQTQQADRARQPEQTQPAVTPAIYTPQTNPATLVQVNAPGRERHETDPAQQARDTERTEAREHTDRWQRDAKQAFDDSAPQRNAGTMTDEDWKPIELQYGKVMAGVQNELRVAANHAAQSGGDQAAIEAAVQARADEIRDRYDDPVVQQNVNDIRDGFLRMEPTQQARDTQGARFELGLAQDRLDQAEATLESERSALAEVPMGVRRADPESGNGVRDATAAVEQAQQAVTRTEEAYVDALQTEIDTRAVALYRNDANADLTRVREQPYDRTISMADRGYDLSQAQSRVDDAQDQHAALQAGRGVRVPEEFRQQAMQDLQSRYGGDEGMRTAIDRANVRAMIAGEMENLTPQNDFERNLAQTDPTTLAMARVQGLTLDPDATMDPNSDTPRDMPADERALMRQNPAAYVLYKSLGADDLVPSADLPANDPKRQAYQAGVEESGLLMYAFTEMQARATADTEGGQGRGTVSEDQRAAATAGVQRMLGLMQGAQPLRTEFLQQNIGDRLEAGDLTGALKLRQAAANAAQTQEERDGYLAVHGDRFGADAFRAEIEHAMRLDLKDKTQDEDYQPILGQEVMYADRVGQYMQDVAPYLIEEDATTLLDTVRSEYSNDWTGRNVSQAGAPHNDWDDFYHGLAVVVDAADAGYYARTPQAEGGTGPAATATANWLADFDNDVSTMVMQNQVGAGGSVYGGARDAAADGHTTLSLALAKALSNAERAPSSAVFDLTNAMEHGYREYRESDEARENQQLFDLDRQEILQQAFDSLALRRDELTFAADDESALNNAIALAAPDADPNAIKDQIAVDAADGATVKVIPIYVTGPGSSPYQSAVFEFRGSDGKTLWVDDQGAVYGKGDQSAERDFQENNELHDHGTVYLARDLGLGPDGHASYDSMDAHIVTGGERFRAWLDIGVTALGAIGGVGVMVASGGTLTPLVAAAWSGMLGSMGYGLAMTAVDAKDMAVHGRSLNPLDNARAFSLWGNAFGSVVGMGGLAVGKGASLALRAAGTLRANPGTFSQMAATALGNSAKHLVTASRVLNASAFGMGGILTSQQAITFVQHGDDMTLTEGLQNGAMLLMGMTQMMPAGIQIRSAQAVHGVAQRVLSRSAANEAAARAAQGQGLQQAMQAAEGESAGLADVEGWFDRVRPGADGHTQGRANRDAATPPRASGDEAGSQHGPSARPAPAAVRPTDAQAAPRPATMQPADGAHAAPSASRAAASAVDGGSRIHMPQRLGTWQSVKLASRLTFDAAVAQGARMQDAVVNRLMDHALRNAMTRYLRDAGERSRHGEAPPPASRAAHGARRRHGQARVAAFAHGGPQAKPVRPARAEPSIVLQNALSPLDRVAGMDGRAMSLSVPYGAELAARALRDVDTVLLATSPATLHGGADTHGPLGAVTLGAYLTQLGKQVIYVTDPAHEAMLTDLLHGELGVADARVETFAATEPGQAARHAQRLLAKYNTQAVVAVEVAGRNRHGEYRLANGERMESAAMVDQLLIEANRQDLVTVAVGADGHAAGMRSALERAVASLHVKPADIDQWSAVGARFPVVGLSADLSAQGIGFALERAIGGDHAMPSTARIGALIDRMARLHAYDGVTLERGATTMRGLDKRSYLGLYELLKAQAQQLPEGLDMARMLDGVQRRFVPKGVDPDAFGINVVDDIIEIAVFDSSNGGILAAANIARHIFAMTGKRVQVVAYGDHAAGTYGGRERDELVRMVNDGLHAMHKQQADANALGCNTACITYPEGWAGLNEKDFINLIHTTARAMMADGGRNIALVATPGTVNNHAYRDALQTLGSEQQLVEIGANEWAAAVNALQHQAQYGPRLAEMEALVARYINPERIPAETESLWLCCTHYPALTRHIRQQLDRSGLGHVKIVDPMEYQARALVERLIERGVLKQEDLLPEPIPFEEVSTADMLPILAVTTGRAGDVVRLAQGMTEDPRARAFGVPEFSPNTDAGQVRGILDANRMPDALDAVVTSYTGRSVDRFAVPQGARRAAASLADGEHVMLLTGFSVADGMPETDGPPGTVALGAMLRAAGKRVTYVVDSANQPVLEAVLAEMGQPLDGVHVFDLPVDGAEPVARAMLAELRPDRVMAAELPGRTAAGTKHNMRGVRIDGFNPAVDQLLISAHDMGITTLAIGDGGNEAGMGNVVQFIRPAPDGSQIASTVKTDFLVTASVSNWGAYAVGAEVLRLAGKADRMPTEDQILAGIEAAVRAGAVDGVSRLQEPTVDGFAPQVHAAVFRMLRFSAGAEALVGPGAPVPTLLGTAAPRRRPLAVLEDLFAHGLRQPFHGAGAWPGPARARHVPPIVDRSWSLLDGAPNDDAIAAVIDGVHATDGRLAGVKYVAVRDGDVAGAKPKVIGAFDSPRQAIAQLDKQLAVGVKVRLHAVPEAHYRQGRAPEPEASIGTLPLSRQDGRTLAGGIALNRRYDGDIRVALPDDFVEGLPLVRNEAGRRIDVLRQLEHFPRAVAHLDLAAEAGYLTFDGRAIPISVPQVPGYFTVRAEGAYQGVKMDLDGSGRSAYDAAALAARIRAHPDYREGMPVLIYDCFGADGPLPLMQQLATELNARVHAPDGVYVRRGWYDGGDTVFGGTAHVDATHEAMAASDAPVHSHGGRFYGASPALPIAGVTEGGRPLGDQTFQPRPAQGRTAGSGTPAFDPAAWAQSAPRYANLPVGIDPIKVLAPDDHLVAAGRFDDERGLLDEAGEAALPHRLALGLAAEWQPGQRVVLALEGGSHPARLAFAQRVADAMGAEVMLPSGDFRLDTAAPTAALRLDQRGVAWQALQPRPYPHAGRSFAVDGDGSVRLIQPDGESLPVELADYLGPRLGSGAFKTVFALGNSHAVGVGNDSMIAAFPMAAEREAMAELASLGLPTLRIDGSVADTFVGHPAIVYERYAASSGALLDADGKLLPEYAALMNARTLRDLDAIEHGIEHGADGTGLLLGDVEFALFPDGRVKIADVLSVESGGGIAAHGEAVTTILAKMREAAQANVARGADVPQGEVRTGTFAHGQAAQPGGPTPRPWRLHATVAGSVGGAFATAAAAMPFLPQPGSGPSVIVAGTCFIYRGSVAAGRTMFANRVIRRTDRQTPADIAWLRKVLTGDRATRIWGINDANKARFGQAIDALESHVSGKGASPDEVADAVQTLKQVGAALLTPDTPAGRVNDAMQIGTLAVNNALSADWFLHNGVDLSNVGTYSTASFLAANSVLASFNIANRVGYHAGVKLPALGAAHARKFVMSMYAVGTTPLAIADATQYGGVAGGLAAASISTFGIGAFLQSRFERGVANREFNKLAAAKGGELKPDQSLLARKWDFFGRALPYGLVLLGGGVVVNFGMKIMIEVFGGNDDERRTDPPSDEHTASPTPTSPTEPPPDSPPHEAPDEAPDETPGETPDETPPRQTERPPRQRTVVVQPYSRGVEVSTLWGIAAGNLDTLLSDSEKQQADVEEMTVDQQVASYALRELINLNPQYNLAEKPDHVEPGWVLDVER